MNVSEIKATYGGHFQSGTFVLTFCLVSFPNDFKGEWQDTFVAEGSDRDKTVWRRALCVAASRHSRKCSFYQHCSYDSDDSLMPAISLWVLLKQNSSA